MAEKKLLEIRGIFFVVMHIKKRQKSRPVLSIRYRWIKLHTIQKGIYIRNRKIKIWKEI